MTQFARFCKSLKENNSIFLALRLACQKENASEKAPRSTEAGKTLNIITLQSRFHKFHKFHKNDENTREKGEELIRHK